jgi:hypothetical protein
MRPPLVVASKSLLEEHTRETKMNGPNSAAASARKFVKLTDEISAIRVMTRERNIQVIVPHRKGAVGAQYLDFI